jgi:hypothetical protein
MSAGDTQHKAGFLIEAKDELSKTLRGYAKELRGLHTLLGEVKRDFASVDAEALKGLGKQAETMAKYLGSARQTVGLGREIAQINEQNAKIDGLRSIAAQKILTEAERTKSILQATGERSESNAAKLLETNARISILEEVRAAKMQAADEKNDIHEARKIETELRISNLIQHSEERSEAAAVRLETSQLRLAQLKERQARATNHQTADEAKILSFQERLANVLPGQGNYIGYGQMLVGQGMGVMRGVAGLGQDHDLRHYLHEKTSFEQMNLSGADNDAALAAAERTRRQVHGLGMAGSVDVAKDLINVIGDVKEALDPTLMQRFAQFKVANKVAYGLTDAQGYDAIKAAELLSPSAKGATPEQKRDALMSKLELEHHMMGGTGGKVTPSDILMFAKRAQSAKMSLTDAGLLKMTGIIQEFGGNTAGTSLMSLMQNLANGRSTLAASAAMRKAGLIADHTPSGGASMDKKGKVMPGGIKGDTLLRQDPLKWAETYLMPLTKGKSVSEVDRLVNSIIGNRTAAGLMMTMLSQDGRLNKEYANTLRARGIANGDQSQEGNYLRAEQDYNTALSDLRVKVGVKILPSLTSWLGKLTDVFERLSVAVDKHPTLTKAAVGGVGLAGAGMVAGGVGFMAKGAWDGLKFMGGAGKSAGGGLMRMLGLSAGEGGQAVGVFARLAALVPRIGAGMTIFGEAAAAVGATLSGPVLLGIAGITVAVGAGVMAWKSNFLGFRSIVVGVGHMIHAGWVRTTGLMGRAWSSMVGGIKSMFSGLPGFINKVLAEIMSMPGFATLAKMVDKGVDWAKKAAAGFTKDAETFEKDELAKMVDKGVDWAKKAAAGFTKDAETFEKDEAADDKGATRNAAGKGGDTHNHFHGAIVLHGVQSPHALGKALRRHGGGPGKSTTAGTSHGGAH